MKQIIHLNEQIRQEIISIEAECERLGEKLKEKYKSDFELINERIVIELIREIKGKAAARDDIFIVNYESYLELGVEKENMYFPNVYIPVWKCKNEMFHNIGLLMEGNIQALEKKIQKIISEMCEDHKRERSLK